MTENNGKYLRGGGGAKGSRTRVDDPDLAHRSTCDASRPRGHRGPVRGRPSCSFSEVKKLLKMSGKYGELLKIPVMLQAWL